VSENDNIGMHQQILCLKVKKLAQEGKEKRSDLKNTKIANALFDFMNVRENKK